MSSNKRNPSKVPVPRSPRPRKTTMAKIIRASVNRLKKGAPK